MSYAESSYEAASRCPKCNNPGEVRSKKPAPNSIRGTMLLHIYCTSVLCPWYNTAWMVQVNPDGTVPEPKNHTGANKMYVTDKKADEMAAQIRAAIDHQLSVETSQGGHGEIRGR